MKHGCDLVIIGLTGMQGFSHLKSQASEKTTEFHNYIYHSTPQNNKCIKNQQNSTKQYLAFIEFPFCAASNLGAAIPNLSLPAPAKFLYSTFMSRFASQSLNKYWHCNAMIFVYRFFSFLHLITKL